jgi:hypothetical protein
MQRKLYLVRVTGGYAEGALIVRSDSAEGAASFLRIRLLDEGTMSPDVGPVTYKVSEEADDLGDGIWLSGYSPMDDLEAVLRTSTFWAKDAVLLWKPPVEVAL